MTVDQYAAERTMLATRDRDELNAIAAAMGVKGTTRLRKAEIVEAILTAAGAGVAIGEPAARPRPSPKRASGKDAGPSMEQPSTGGGPTESSAPEAPEPRLATSASPGANET
ncbi:MAG: Rho termination factor N-terminal domain-containing protein, partial [Acidimicrobiia bacterium]